MSATLAPPESTRTVADRWSEIVADLTRRRFILGGTAAVLGVAGCNASAGSAGPTPAGDRTVTTSLGTYAIPAQPQRVIAVDSRLDLEPAVALQLPVIGHSYGKPEPRVPVGNG